MLFDHATAYARDDICFTFKAGNFGVAGQVLEKLEAMSNEEFAGTAPEAAE